MIAAPATAVDLDLWLPGPTVRTYHRREAASDPAMLWAAGGSVRIGESGLLAGFGETIGETRHGY
jgi:hypothetical protein